MGEPVSIRLLAPGPMATGEPEHGNDKENPQHGMDEQAENGGYHNDDDRDEDVDEHACSSPSAV